MIDKVERRKVILEVKMEKQLSWTEFGNRLIVKGSYAENQKQFYTVMKNTRNKKIHFWEVKGKKGKILTATEDIMERWKHYICDNC